MVPRSFVELLGRLQACVPQRSPAEALSHILEAVDYKAHLLASLALNADTALAVQLQMQLHVHIIAGALHQLCLSRVAHAASRC